MKRLSISLPALALALSLFLSSATVKKDPPTPSVPAPVAPTAPSFVMKSTPAKKMVYMYYWYTPKPLDTFIDWNDLADETAWWIWDLGWQCDTNPSNGVLIAVGYMQTNYPHVAYPAVYLYVHIGL